MSYLSFYRKYRPQTFEDVVGQEHIVRTIKNAIELDRVSHAYLFCGPRGTGKTTMAKLLAKSLNCTSGPTPNPCGSCDSCQGIASGTSVDVVEIDAASNRGIDEIRELREKIRYAPSVSRFKVYIVDEVHMLTAEAFNALLKTLEEPPSHAVFVLATTEPHRIPETIHSRCQRFDFHKLPPKEIAGHLASILDREGGSAEDDALQVIALHGDGSVRDAISILEQCYSYSGDRITVDDVISVLGITPIERIEEFINAISERSVGDLLRIVTSLSSEGRDFRQFLRDSVSVYRDLIVLKLSSQRSDQFETVMLSRLDPEGGRSVASRLELHECIYVVEKLASIETELKTSVQPSITLEVGLIELAESIDSRSDITEESDLKSLSRRLVVLERKVAELVRRLSRSSGVAVSADGETEGGGDPEPAPGQRRGMSGTHGDTDAESTESSDRRDEDSAGESLLDESSEEIVDQAELDRMFGEILEGVKQRSIPLHAVMREGKPLILKDGVLILVFDAQHSFHMGRVSEAKNRQLIEDVAALVLGKPVRVLAKPSDMLMDSSPVGASTRARRPGKATRQSQRPEDDPLVKQVLEVFQGRIIDPHSVDKDGDAVEGKHQQAHEAGSEDAGSNAEGPR